MIARCSKVLLLAFLFIGVQLHAYSQEEIADYEKKLTKKPLTHEVVPIAKTKFKIIDLKTGDRKIVDLSGKNFVLVSVREKGSDGRFYAIDQDGTVWLSGGVSSGAAEFRSPSGIFKIFQKKRYHMSSEYPDPSGVNNMDFMMKFTKRGHALHKGSINWMSHGCIHIDPKDVPVLYKWADLGTTVVVTRHSYMPFAKEDLRKIYLGY